MRGPPGKGQKLCLRPFHLALVMWHRVTAFLQWIMPPRALPHCKYAAVRAAARGTVNMQRFELATISVAPSDFQSFVPGLRRAPEDPLVINRAVFSFRTSARDKSKERRAASEDPFSDLLRAHLLLRPTRPTHSTHWFPLLTSPFSLLTPHSAQRTSHFSLLKFDFSC